MLTKITIKNFKKLDAEIELDDVVVFVGPNNSGKTTALQAITLWELGMRKWVQKTEKSKAKERIAATINRQDLIMTPITHPRLLWKDTLIRKSYLLSKGKHATKNAHIEIEAEGFSSNINWTIGFEFDYANQESIYCRLRKGNSRALHAALKEHIGILPPMSGLSLVEDKFTIGSIQKRIGQGMTAEILRNLCLIVFQEKKEKWDQLVQILYQLFRVKLKDPIFNLANGQISISYNEDGKRELDLSSGGRGFHQILLLFAFIYANPNTVLLIDEPDAHLEVIRQGEIYNLLKEVIRAEHSQLIVATHSEKVLSEAAEADKIIGFLGKPHVVNKPQQLVKSLTTIGFDQYLLAEQKRFILYLEGQSDLAMLKAFAQVLKHPIRESLNEVFIKYVGNNPSDSRSHFYALVEAVPDLQGIAIFDHLDKYLQEETKLTELMWRRREIENYLPIPQVIQRYIESQVSDLFSLHEWKIMKEIIEDYIPRIAINDPKNDWWIKTKISDDFLDIVFRSYFGRIGMPPSFMQKGKYNELALLSNVDEFDVEVKEKLDAIWKLIQDANEAINKKDLT